MSCEIKILQPQDDLSLPLTVSSSSNISQTLNGHDFAVISDDSNFSPFLESKYIYQLLRSETKGDLICEIRRHPSLTNKLEKRYYKQDSLLGEGTEASIYRWQEIKFSSAKLKKKKSAKSLAIRVEKIFTTREIAESKIINGQKILSLLHANIDPYHSNIQKNVGAIIEKYPYETPTKNKPIALNRPISFISSSNSIGIFQASTIHKVATENNLSCFYKTVKSKNFEELLNIYQQLSQTLKHAHSKGIIFLDIKLENILVTKKTHSSNSPHQFLYIFNDLMNAIDLNTPASYQNRLRTTLHYTENTDFELLREAITNNQDDIAHKILKAMDIYALGITFLACALKQLKINDMKFLKLYETFSNSKKVICYKINDSLYDQIHQRSEKIHKSKREKFLTVTKYAATMVHADYTQRPIIEEVCNFMLSVAP